ncbi:hypothetical protein K402DRAFT_235240 [Aulographum hederae CBS 113979]|uniref:Uncharacterized protein n=1 Tax=Aulographum hederae CBS 113979 TaxID=1176131 RepID=A0A6G1GLC6_9PEZI|nr:hypothetical protein K402DRAFT_235240 [Aulographum hederae CBS 113979]
MALTSRLIVRASRSIPLHHTAVRVSGLGVALGRHPQRVLGQVVHALDADHVALLQRHVLGAQRHILDGGAVGVVDGVGAAGLLAVDVQRHVVAARVDVAADPDELRVGEDGDFGAHGDGGAAGVELGRLDAAAGHRVERVAGVGALDAREVLDFKLDEEVLGDVFVVDYVPLHHDVVGGAHVEAGDQAAARVVLRGVEGFGRARVLAAADERGDGHGHFGRAVLAETHSDGRLDLLARHGLEVVDVELVRGGLDAVHVGDGETGGEDGAAGSGADVLDTADTSLALSIHRHALERGLRVVLADDFERTPELGLTLRLGVVLWCFDRLLHHWHVEAGAQGGETALGESDALRGRGQESKRKIETHSCG